MRLRLIVLLCAAVLLLSLPVFGQAGASEFSGSGVSASVFLDWGEYLCPGGEPAGPWPPTPPCSPGSRVQVRGMVYEFNVAGDDNRVTGVFHNVFNANTDGWTPFGPGSGQLWGTSRLEVVDPDGWTPTGEVWEGNWIGKRVVTAKGATSTVMATLHGKGGRIEGLIAKWMIYIPHSTPLTFEGWIIVPGSTKK
jgi:hypothetical protein